LLNVAKALVAGKMGDVLGLPSHQVVDSDDFVPVG
jgi:hypothetical protein